MGGGYVWRSGNWDENLWDGKCAAAFPNDGPSLAPGYSVADVGCFRGGRTLPIRQVPNVGGD